MPLKDDWSDGDTYSASDQNAVSAQVNANTDDIAGLTSDDIADGTTYKRYSATDKTKLAGIEAAADVTDAGNIASTIHAATAKTTPVTNDEIALIDSAASNVLKRMTYGNLATAIVALITASAPTTLDTLDELAAALGDDPNFATTMATALGNKQPLDSDLTTIAGLTATTDNFMVAVSSAWASRTPSQVRTTLGLVIGTNVQAWDADLDTWATKTAPSGTVIGTTDTQTMSAKTLTNPTVNNYTEGVVAIGNTGTSQTLDLTSGTVQTATLTGNCTFTMPTATAGKSFTLLLKTGAGSFTSTFTSVKWAGGTAPTITTTASRMDILVFFADGTNWYGSFTQNYTP